MASASDFKDAVSALQKTNAELGKEIGGQVRTGLAGAAKDITKPFTDSLSAIPGMSTLGGLGKTLFNKALSTRKEKKAQELLRKQLGVSKEQFKLLKDEKNLSDKRKAVNDSMLAASENLLGFTGEKFSAMMAGALKPGLDRVVDGNGKMITGMDTLFKDQMKVTIAGNKLLENPKPTAAETESLQKEEAKAAREQSVFHDIRDGIVGLNDKFMQKMKEKGKAGLGLIAALIAAPIVALLAFFKEIGLQLKMLGITGKGGLVAKMFGPIGKVFAGIKNFFKSFGVVKKITPFIDDIVKGAKTVLKPIGNFFTKIGNFFSKMIGYVKTIVGASKSATGILKFASGFGRILGKLFLPVTIVMSAFDFITGFIDGWKESDGDSIVSKFIDGVGGGLSKLIGNLVGMPLDLLKDGVSWIMGMLGFDKAAEALDSFSFKDLIMDIVKMPFDLLSDAVDYITGIFSGGTDLMGDMGNIMDTAKNFIKSVLRSVLPNPDGGFFAQFASKAIPDSVYEFAGLDPKTGKELPIADPPKVDAKPDAKADFNNRPNAFMLANIAAAKKQADNKAAEAGPIKPKQDATMAEKLAKTERVKQERRQKILERLDARIEATEDRILTGQDEKGRQLSPKRLEYEQKKLASLERSEQKLLARQAASGAPPPAGFNVSTSDKKVENHFPAMTQPQSPTLNANLNSTGL